MKPHSDEIKQKALSLKQADPSRSARSIAQEVGVSKGCIINWLAAARPTSPAPAQEPPESTQEALALGTAQNAPQEPVQAAEHAPPVSPSPAPHQAPPEPAEPAVIADRPAAGDILVRVDDSMRRARIVERIKTMAEDGGAPVAQITRRLLMLGLIHAERDPGLLARAAKIALAGAETPAEAAQKKMTAGAGEG